MQLFLLLLVAIVVDHSGAVSAASSSPIPRSGIRQNWAKFIDKLTGKSIQRTDSELKSGIAKLYDEVRTVLTEIG
mgnify:CR=1 FL=1